MEENQAVVLWGTDAGAESGDDPPSFQATNAEPLIWDRASDRCSVFLLVMLHWEAAFGGAMPRASTAAVSRDLAETLDLNWSFIGEVNGLRAYNRTGAAICFLRWDENWRIFAGFTTAAAMTAVAWELGVVWETPTC